MQVIIKKTGIDQIVKNLLPELIKDLKSQKIDDITGQTKVAVVGMLLQVKIIFARHHWLQNDQHHHYKCWNWHICSHLVQPQCYHD